MHVSILLSCLVCLCSQSPCRIQTLNLSFACRKGDGSRQILSHSLSHPSQALHPAASNSCMPHGHLTPLGHRLRSVLAALRPNALHLDNPSIASKQLPSNASSYTTDALIYRRRPTILPGPTRTATPIQVNSTGSSLRQNLGWRKTLLLCRP
jgi:hypothetical protein